MKALVIRGYGGLDMLDVAEVPAPKVGPGQVLIRVAAAGVNPIDWRIRKGEMKMMVRAKLPITLGAEVSGEIAEVGSGVTRLKVGDAVYSLVPGDIGGFAEYVAVPEEAAAVRPKTVDAVRGATVPVGSVTALQSLRDKGELRSGQRVLVNGASGGVGLFAVQLAKELGAEVTAVCSEAKFEMVRKAGASECIDYKKSDFTTLGKKWDLIFDSAATKKFSDCRKALEPAGHYVTTIGSGGDMIMPALNAFRSQKGRFIIVKPSAKDLEYVGSLLDAGKLTTSAAHVFPMAQMAEAQKLSESGKATGKIVVTVSA
jgi:NADPH:quinone reductase-like Zn-dependent oxidoreductase